MVEDDWKGEGLIRGVRPTKAERQAGDASASVRIGKRSGRWPTPEKTKRSHAAFVKAALGAFRATP